MEEEKNNNSIIMNTKASHPETKINPKQEVPPSTSLSPSHDFSFTISLQPLSSYSSHSKPNPNNDVTTTKTTSSSSSTPLAVDLSPADDIFFHGHLLPLHLLSHLPVSPRTSTGSLDAFALPLAHILPNSAPAAATTTHNSNSNSNNNNNDNNDNVKNKPIRSFSIFNMSKWRKGSEAKHGRGEEEEEAKQQQKRKKKKKKKLVVGLELSHAVKKYIRMLFQRRENGTQFMRKRQAYSFTSASTASMSTASRNIKENWRGGGGGGGRREFSAPASMRTSPTNSGHLQGISTTTMTKNSSCCSSSSDSTMEELQEAIQAAIAHCKNSINSVHDPPR